MRLTYGKPSEREVRELEAEARMLTGLVHKFRGRYTLAVEHFRAARTLFESTSHAHHALNAMVREAFALENAHDYAAAETMTREALDRAKQIADDRARGAMLNNLGLALTALGNHDEGMERQRESLALREKIGDDVGQAVSLGSMGLTLLKSGRPDEAL